MLEDDPYYFLSFPSQQPQPSFFSMDTEQRVIRLDSFSKVMSAGIRIGFATGPAALMSKIEQSMQYSVLHANSLAQVMLLALLQKWGPAGWDAHVHQVKELYAGRAKMFEEIARQYLGDSAEWTSPTAGMFVWINLKKVPDTKDLVQQKAREKKVLMVPGAMFFGEENGRISSFVRTAYSTASKEDMEEAFKRLSSLL